MLSLHSSITNHCLHIGNYYSLHSSKKRDFRVSRWRFACKANPDERANQNKVLGVTEGCKLAVIAACAALSLISTPSSSLAALEPEKNLDPDIPVLDLARVVPELQEETLIKELKQLEQDKGWKLRLLTRIGPKQGPTGEEIKRAWQYDRKTGIIVCDPTSPNILQFQVGDDIARLLSRGFFIELQSRFGNKFYVRDEGESGAVLESIRAMTTCLNRGGCTVVPGIPDNQYQLTLITSIIGGFVFGFSTTIQPQGFVRRKFIWSLLFAPLWGTLFISFGLGPILTRTEDRLPLLQNLVAFLVAAGVFRLSPLFKPGAVDLDIISKEGQRKREERDR